MIRPGGFELTDRALMLAGLLPGSTVFDIGCGSGETVRYLLGKGYDAGGIDLCIPDDDSSAVAENHTPADDFLTCADAAAMPYGTASADGLLFECSFTKMREPERVLEEAFRVLKPRGRLMVADMVARKEEGLFDGYLGRLETAEHLKERLTEAGFTILAEESHDRLVKAFSGNLILKKGSAEAERLLGGSLGEVKKTGPGYLLLVLEKSDKVSGKPDTGRETCQGKAEKKVRAGAGAGNGGGDFTDAEDLCREPERFLKISQTRVKRVVTLQTSGTTGRPKRIFFSEKDLERTVQNFVSGMEPMAKAGQSAGILFPGTGENGLPELIREALERLGVKTEIFRTEKKTAGVERSKKETADADLKKESAQESDALAGNASEADRELLLRREFCRGKDFLVGMPGDICRIAKHAPELRPAAVLLSGDYVPESLRKGLEELWGCEVFTHYGMTETGFCLAVECSAHKGLHLWTGDVKVKIADPETGVPLPAGEEGELVITAENREAMPLINYRTGDLGILAPDGEVCPCGSRTPRIMKITGRKHRPAGVPEITELAETLYHFPGISAFRAEIGMGQNFSGQHMTGTLLSESSTVPVGRRSIPVGRKEGTAAVCVLSLECVSAPDLTAIKKCLETEFQGTEFLLSEAENLPFGRKQAYEFTR